jgi:MerR family transcriptional regulator, copper efflux regulator
MNIGAAEQASGLPAKTIRYYEDIGLLVPARQDNGYREYGLTDVHKLAFLKRARGLGFTIEECRALLSLYEDRNRASADVKSLAHTHLHRIEAKIRELQGLRDVLFHLVEACHGDDRPNCPILDDLSGRLGGHD